VQLRIKICGITNREDALAAVDAGADALGFVFVEPSPRWISPDVAASIIRDLPPLISKVGVFVNAPPSFVTQAVVTAGLDVLQFHGEESPEYCRGFPSLPKIKAFRIQGPETLPALRSYATAAWLLDSYDPRQRGGTGRAMNWDLAVEARGMGRPIILAGGLTPANVAEAVRRVRPYAVDVSSGVETTPGRKDGEKLRQFVAWAREA
jgi:phosphoribosylanthranilate isomerase